MNRYTYKFHRFIIILFLTLIIDHWYGYFLKEAAVLRKKIEDLEKEGETLKKKVKDLQDKLSVKASRKSSLSSIIIPDSTKENEVLCEQKIKVWLKLFVKWNNIINPE